MQSLFEYDYALYNRVWDSINLLTDEQFVQEVEYSHGSVRNQIVHVAMAERRWLMALHEHPEAREYSIDPADFPDRASAHSLWTSTAQDVANYIDLLNDDELDRVPYGMKGPVRQVLTHLVNHGTDHRAQILRILHDFGAPTFDQYLILYLWNY
jgi:uncharacterized damage-inducible protein DinB